MEGAGGEDMAEVGVGRAEEMGQRARARATTPG